MQQVCEAIFQSRPIQTGIETNICQDFSFRFHLRILVSKFIVDGKQICEPCPMLNQAMHTSLDQNVTCIPAG